MNRACFLENTNLHEQNKHAVPIAMAPIAIRVRPIKINFVRMKIKILGFILFLCVFNSFLTAQNFGISFTGKGISTTVTSVTVENITKGVSITINGNDTLYLTGTTELDNLHFKLNKGLKISQNKEDGSTDIEFMTQVSGFTSIGLYNLKGQLLTQWNENLPVGNHSFSINGINKGICLLKVSSGSNMYKSKLFGTNETNSRPGIKHIISRPGNANQQASNKFKSSKIYNQLTYDNGDILLATGKYENSSKTFVTVSRFDPRIITALIFHFIECVDGDGNLYPVVSIGPQHWMAKNLRTTKLNDMTPIAPDSSLTKLIPAYRTYQNTKVTDTINTYGRLYNWYAVNTNKLCPVGWHVPSKEEWATLTETAGGNSLAGSSLKERGTYHWTYPNTGAIDGYGFGALPGGCVASNEEFTYMGKYGFYWSSTEVSTKNASLWTFEYNNTNFMQDPSNKTSGYSVRCLSDY